jgi:enterochelin esterase-like enzyme
MKRSAVLLALIAGLFFPGISQPEPGNSFTLYRDLVYSKDGNTSWLLDLYLPGGASLPAGVGVTGKEQEMNAPKKQATSARAVIIWIPATGNDKFPTPVAAWVGNGFAVVCLQARQEATVLNDLSKALDYLQGNAATFDLEMENIGLIQQHPGGYRAAIWQRDMLQLKPVGAATLQMNIVAASDPDFSILQSGENSGVLLTFFDKHLRNGKQTKSDPLALKCPKDSWVDPITNPIPGTTYHLFPTPVRGKNLQGSYLIYLPRDYATSGERYPVIYWLHGGNGNSREGAWMCGQLDTAMQRGDMPPCIVVFVQGLPIGWYNNSKDGTMPVEDVIIKDLIPHIDATYRTINRREARGIDGMSMGGYGSLHLGFKYPELFGVVSSIAPSITSYEMERKEVIMPTFEDDTAYFNANSPSTLVKVNADYLRNNTTIRLLAGDKDFLYDLIQHFHQQLKDLQISHQYGIAPGADHDYREVISKLEFNAFAFWGSAFKSVEQ